MGITFRRDNGADEKENENEQVSGKPQDGQ